MVKKIYKVDDIIPQIFEAIDILTEPIVSTLSPKGSNVVYEDVQGNQNLSQDGITVAKNIVVADPIQNAIIEIIKSASLKTNIEAGDGTSRTIGLSSVLTKEGLKMVINGNNRMDVRDEINNFAKLMKEELTKKVVKIKNDKDLEFIARISANNDLSIAKDVVKIVKFAGEDGQILLDEGYHEETEIIEDMGFILKTGLFAPELGNNNHQSRMLDVPILITDKKIYYKSEAETILSTVLNAGYNEVVIIAEDFVGEALPFFIANHKNGKVKVILISEKRLEIMEDLAIYLGGEVISDKKGTLVDNITIDDFMMTQKCYADKYKTIITRDKNEKNRKLNSRIKALKSEMKSIGNKNHPDYTRFKNRVSSLTSGMVTVKIGGRTPIERVERIYRYEDAVNAVRAAMKEGYLPGSGVAEWAAYNSIESKIKPEFRRLFRLVSEYTIRQVAKNCGKNADSIIEKLENLPYGHGYNAVNDKIEDMIKVGVIEPFLVTSQVVTNAASIANVIVTSKYLVVNDIDYQNKLNENNKQNG